ncbi:folate transporter 1, chloroplastic-like isoform X2 [Andrographis paniculata]|uniref:folate transporter 1, chloroplastic-like isoform X2 n=1 Tax=Andrographis paniculata TaxID=175694 RepID=UPI0021E8BE25|nr:folate transporter 1, chloroplastic-like isoform X2 [Andrographis paniculata]
MINGWQWENAVAGSAAGLATVSFTHPLDVVRTRFQVNDGRISNIPTYKNTPHGLFNIARAELQQSQAEVSEEQRGARTHSASCVSCRSRRPGLSLHQSCLVSLCTNPVWMVKARLQLQTPQHGRPYSGFHDALRTILKEEGWRALYKGLVPGLFLVTHGAVQFTAYEELRKFAMNIRIGERKNRIANGLLDSFDYAFLGAVSKLAAILLTYPFQVIRSRLQQRPGIEGIPRYMDSFHVVKDTARVCGGFTEV